jgi:hypothetical protein
MLTKTKFASVFGALVLGVTAFASTGEARSPYDYWDRGWEVPVGYGPVSYAPIGYASYFAQTRHGPRVCQGVAEYTDWGFWTGRFLIDLSGETVRPSSETFLSN